MKRFPGDGTYFTRMDGFKAAKRFFFMTNGLAQQHRPNAPQKVGIDGQQGYDNSPVKRFSHGRLLILFSTSQTVAKYWNHSNTATKKDQSIDWSFFVRAYRSP